MKNTEESKLSMFLTVANYQTGYTAITTTLPNYAANAAILLSIIPQVQTFATQQKVSKMGIAESKDALRKVLEVQTADYGRKLAAYAKLTNNLTLAQEVKIAESTLKQVADTAMRDYGQLMYDRAQPIVASLAPYGITAASQTQLLGAISAYNAIMGKPSAGRVESKLTTKQLVGLLKLGMDTLALMDAAVEIVKVTQPIFYSGYRNARRIIVTGTGSLALKGLVREAVSGQPVKGVTIEFVLNEGVTLSKVAGTKTKVKANVVKKSADKGGFNIKTLPTGNYTVLLKKQGYAEHSTTVYVNSGEPAELIVDLELI